MPTRAPEARTAGPRLSRRALAVEESLTLALGERVAELKAKGVDVVSFAAGEPDFDTPEHIKKAAVEALARGHTRYTASSGILPLRRAIAAKLERENGVAVEPSAVLVSTGAKQAIYNVLQATVEEGDEVVFAAPYYLSYPEMVKAAGAKPVALPTGEKEGFKLAPERLARAITPRTKLFIHCSPSNPTGVVYSEGELRALAEVVVGGGLLCVSDEIYEKLVYGGARHVSIASLGPEIRERTVVVNGFSKSFAMTGWRMGYAAGPAEIIAAAGRIQSQSTSNATSISQYAALAALEGDQSFLGTMREEYQKRRDAMVARLRTVPGVTCVEPEGAFYAFPGVRGLLGRRRGGREIPDAAALAAELLEAARVSVVPGASFGAPDHLRFSYATSMKNILEGMDRFERFVRELG